MWRASGFRELFVSSCWSPRTWWGEGVLPRWYETPYEMQGRVSWDFTSIIMISFGEEPTARKWRDRGGGGGNMGK